MLIERADQDEYSEDEAPSFEERSARNVLWRKDRGHPSKMIDPFRMGSEFSETDLSSPGLHIACFVLFQAL